MRQSSTETSQRYTNCLELYIKYGGKNVSRIEREMRRLGHRGFTRRILYNRTERGLHRPGWIERFGWRELGSEPPASAGGFLTPRSDGQLTAGLKTPAHQGGNTTGRECVPPTERHRSEHCRAPFDAARCTVPPDYQASVRERGSSISRYEVEDPRPRLMKPSTRARFKSWLKLVSPSMTWDWAHQEYLYSYLNKVSDGTCKRLMIFMPPRHGKSETVTVRYTAWRLAHDPSMNVILGSYNQRLANRFSRKIRRVLTDDAALAPELEPSRSVPPAVAGGALQPPTDESRHETNHGLCPQCHRQKASGKTDESKSSRPCTHAANRLNFTHRPANSEAEWETGQGGGLRAVGVGSGVTGFGASLIVVDDPVKSRAEAESETYRNKVWDWFNDDLYTRLEPNGSIILIQTRWHEDDLAGRLIKEMNDGGEHWDIVNLPALCEAPDAGQNRPRERAGSSAPQLESRLKAGLKTPPERSQEGGFTPALTPTEYDPIGRLPGDALCPERYDEAALEKMRRKLGSYSFSALYQQRPVPAEGGLFKMSWFKNMVAAPPPGLKWNRGYDLAVSIKTTACYTASARCAFDREGNLYISDVFRQRLEFPDQRKYIVGRINLERDTEHGVELALHGHAIIQDLRRDPQLRGRPFRGVKVDADKITRALGWANLAEEGKVILVRGPWIQEFLNEVREFPSGKFDDQIDAVSLAVNMCKRRVRSFHSF